MARGAQIDPRGTGNSALIADPANPRYKVIFSHIATGEQVAFTAWVTDFNDNFSSQWNEETVYGRMDPLATFQGTQRNISMGLEVVAANREESINNTAKVDKLLRFLYPMYETGEQAYYNTLSAPPLLTMRWLNFAVGQLGEDLVGFIRNLSYTPVFDSGLFINKSAFTETGTSTQLFPQLLRLQFDFKVIHTHMTGWTAPGLDVGGIAMGDPAKFGGGDSLFPHGAGNEVSPTSDGRPCLDGPWIPDSAINTSQNQRSRRLLMEENAQNSIILSGHKAGKDRIEARNRMRRTPGRHYNAGCLDQNEVTPTMAQRIAEQQEIANQMKATRKAGRKAKKYFKGEYREQPGLDLDAFEAADAALRANTGQRRRQSREQIRAKNRHDRWKAEYGNK